MHQILSLRYVYVCGEYKLGLFGLCGRIKLSKEFNFFR